MTRLSAALSLAPGDVLTKLDAMAKAGFSGVELDAADLTGFAGTPSEVGQHAARLGLSIDALHPFGDIEGLTGDDHKAAVLRLDRILVLMQALRAKTLVVGTTTRRDANADGAAQIADLALLARRAGDAGCRAALLARPTARHVTRDTDALALVEAVDSPHLGLALNSAFSLADGSQAARLRHVPGARVFHVQLADAPALMGHTTQSGEPGGLLPGEGRLNLASFVRVLARAGYDGPWSLANVTASVTDPRATFAQDGYRALVSLLDDVAATEPDLPPPVADLPDRVHATGFEFIEFAADANDHAALTALLSALTFRKERTHRSKSVELWRQGAVNIVVNSEQKGFAARSRADHGPGVCDMGLRVRDADQTVKRALMLGAPAFLQPAGAGELDIPAITGVGGSVVHFIDEKSDLHRVWDIEFDPVPKSVAPQPAGLRRIDHVAQTMRYQDMQSWLTYYLTTFRMEKADVVDVVDPSGLIQSQALSSPEGEVRLNLNGAGADPTFARTFLSKGPGAGVQHIAFATDDIFETSARLSAAKFRRLQIAANYYDDLQVTFNLDDTTVADLKQGNILYDRDGRGEYFQIYSTALWDGFFFEVVERRGGYEGYGARNAPVRLAAQMQQHRNEANTQ